MLPVILSFTYIIPIFTWEWIMETGKDQTKEDGKQIFAGGIQVESSAVNGGGITGVFSAGGVENR